MRLDRYGVSIKESKKMNLVSRLALLSLMLTGQAWSQSTEEQSAVHPYLTDKFMLDLGAFRTESARASAPLLRVPLQIN